VIYLDSSVALAHLLGEDQLPSEALWRERLTSSELIEYEIWNRIYARNLAHTHRDEVVALLARVALIELARPVLARALQPFPVPVRTLDGLHLATIEHLRAGGAAIELASFDRRLIAGARALGIAIYSL